MKDAEKKRGRPARTKSSARGLQTEIYNFLAGKRAPVSVATIAEEVAASKQTVERVLADIDEAHIIERSDDPSHPQRQLVRLARKRGGNQTRSELRAVLSALLASRTSPQMAGFALDTHVDNLLAQLEPDGAGPDAALLKEMKETLVRRSFGGVRYTKEHAQMLFTFLEAKTQGKAVRAVYQRPGQRGTTKPRLLALGKAFTSNGALYLVVKDMAKGHDGPLFPTALHRYSSVSIEKAVTATVDAGAAEQIADGLVG